MEKNKLETIIKLILFGAGTVLGGFIFYWAFSFVWYVIKVALQG